MSSSTKVGRNDSCPCGSGKKHKNCCEGREAQRATRMTSWALLCVAVLAAALAGGFVYSSFVG